MKHSGLAFMLFIAITASKCSNQTNSQLIYPESKKIDHIDNYGETKISDPYQWMEQLDSPALKQWMLEQEELYSSFLSQSSSLIDEFNFEIAEQFEKDVTFAPVQSGGKFFLPVTAAGASAGKFYLLDNEGEERRLLMDLDKFNDDEKTYSINSYSPVGKYIAVTESINKSRYTNVFFYDVSANQTLSDTISGFYGGRSFMSWKQDATGFYYSKYQVPQDLQAPLPRAKFMYHKIGTTQDRDITIFENTKESKWIFRGSTTFDDQFLILQISDPSSLGNMIYVKDLTKPAEPFTWLVKDFDHLFTFLYKSGDRLFFHTTFEAPNHRVVAIDANDLPNQKWEEIIPESDQVISGSYVVGSKLALRSNIVTRKVLNVYDLDGTFQYTLDPDGSTLYFSQADRASTKGYMMVSSVLSPVSVYEVDLQSGKNSLYSQVKLSVDPAEFTFEHTSFVSSDGTEVPIQLIYRKGLKKNGNAPVFLYGYGAFNWSAYPWQNYLRQWINRGGIYAVPNIRGGGVYGADWYQAGSRQNKQKTIDDYISAAEWIIKAGYSRKGMIVANGGSASGLLPAIAINKRPELYGACIIDYPVLDMLRYHKFGSANWTSEFGTSDEPTDFELLRSYSPYHNINENSCYPPTIVQVGELDNTTTPMHGYKYAAALQNALSNACQSPVLLKISRGAGHSAGATRKDRIRTQAEQMAFLFNVLGLDSH